MLFRRNILGLSITLICTALFFSSFGQLYINEFLSSNNSVIYDTDFGNYSDWIEFYNAGNQATDLGGYFITDDLNEPDKWQIPPNTIIDTNSFLLFWADGKDKIPGDTARLDWDKSKIITVKDFHLNFKLSKDGEQIGLFNENGTQIDAISFNVQPGDISHGRNPDNLSQWLYFGEPSPGSQNGNDGVLNVRYSEQLEFSIKGGIYAAPQLLILTTNSPGSNIRYTLDGSKPNSTSALYTSPITINKTSFNLNKLH